MNSSSDDVHAQQNGDDMAAPPLAEAATELISVATATREGKHFSAWWREYEGKMSERFETSGWQLPFESSR
jgi:hypothetical protein